MAALIFLEIDHPTFVNAGDSKRGSPGSGIGRNRGQTLVVDSHNLAKRGWYLGRSIEHS